MIRGVLREEQGPRRLRRMHGRILEVLREHPAWCASGDPREELATHAMFAELDEEALPLLLAAGDARLQEANVEQALELSRQALTCMDRLTEIGRGESVRRRLLLLHRLVLCAVLMGRPALAAPWIATYLELEGRERRNAARVPLLRTAYPHWPTLDPAFTSNTADTELCGLLHRGLVERHPWAC